MLARAFVLLVALLLVLFSAANMDILWEKGIGLLLPGSVVDVEGISTDIFKMVSARELRLVARSPAAPPLEITGRDIFIAYDPWLRREISVEIKEAVVEGSLRPAAGPGRRALPFLGSFHRFYVRCPKARLLIRWRDCVFSCGESRLTAEGISGGSGIVNWEIPRLEIRKGGSPLAVLGDIRIIDSFESEGAVDGSSILAGRIEAGIRSVELDMETLSGAGNRERFLFTGLFAGKASVVLEERRLKSADAELLSEGGGSVAVSKGFIEDYLGGMAPGGRRDSMKIVLENLQDYTFNKGELRVKLVGDRIVVNVDLDGESGARSLELNLHDFLKGGRVVGIPVVSRRRESP